MQLLAKLLPNSTSCVFKVWDLNLSVAEMLFCSKFESFLSSKRRIKRRSTAAHASFRIRPVITELTGSLWPNWVLPTSPSCLFCSKVTRLWHLSIWRSDLPLSNTCITVEVYSPRSNFKLVYILYNNIYNWSCHISGVSDVSHVRCYVWSCHPPN